MNIFAKFESLEYLTSNEKILIDYIKKDPVKFTQMGINQICDNCNVSKSTLIRFCKKLGYDGFNQFKLFLVASFSDQLAHAKFNVDFNFPFNENHGSLEIVASIRRIYEQSVYITSNFLNLSEIETAVKAINKADKLLICADAEGYHVADIFKDKLEKIGKSVIMPTNDFMKISNLGGLSYNDIMICIDLSMGEKKFKELTKICRLNKIKIVLISVNKNRILNNNFMANIYLLKNESIPYNIGDFSIIVSLMYLLDAIYSLIYKIEYAKNNEILYSNYLKYKNL